MPCDPIRTSDGSIGFICSRGATRTRLVCDVCDKPVKKAEPKIRWRGLLIDLCPRCKARRQDPEWREQAERTIATHYPEVTIDG